MGVGVSRLSLPVSALPQLPRLRLHRASLLRLGVRTGDRPTLEKQKDGQLVEFEMILGQGLLDGGDMWAPVLQRRCS